MEENNNMKKKWSSKRPKAGKHAGKGCGSCSRVCGCRSRLQQTVLIRSRNRSRQSYLPLECRKQ